MAIGAEHKRDIRRALECPMTDHAARLKRLHYRAWHRGTREADYVVGGYFDAHHAAWNEDELSWFEALIEEQDVDILAWALGTAAVPQRWHGPMMVALRRLDYVDIAP
jgi:antitoxin CptB